jgi:hypothetical protein
MPDSISCPNCQTEIPLTAALSHQVEERLRGEFAQEKAELIAAQSILRAEKDRLVEATDEAIEVAASKARAEALEVAEAKATERVSAHVRDLAERLSEQEELRREAQERELELRKEKRQLEAEREEQELRVQRQLDQERDAIVASTTERLEEGWQMKVREKDLTLEQMRKRIDDLQAAADQKRSGLQGEVLEREIEDVLREAFASDSIEPVKSGKRGADVVQRVRTGRGECGTLLWESKNHKHWSDGWLDKLRADQQAERADVAIIVTSAFPDGLSHVGFVRGVWVCDFAHALPLAIALRQQLEAVRQAHVVNVNRSRVADDLYEYVCGQEFQHYVTNAVVAGMTMKRELDAERTVAERTFKKREKQIEAQIRSFAGLYGGLQGIAAGALQPVAALEAPPADDVDGESGHLALAI